MSPPLVCFVGRKGSGKNALMGDIIAELSRRGYRVAAVCDNSQQGPDRAEDGLHHRLYSQGACGLAQVSAVTTDFFLPARSWDETVLLLTRVFGDCHLVLIEGGPRSSPEKIEIVSENGAAQYSGDPALRAVVGPAGAGDDVPLFAPQDIGEISDFIEGRYLTPRLSAAVLAGGRSSRLGRNKALLQFGGMTLIERILKALSRCVAQVTIVTNRPDEYRHLGLSTVGDVRPGCGPLSGIHAALSHSPTDYVLVVSCDVPLVGEKQFRPLMHSYPGRDIVMYKHRNFEPLCAIYRRSCLKALDELIDHRECRIIDLFPTLDVHILRAPDEAVFASINTEQDYKALMRCRPTSD